MTILNNFKNYLISILFYEIFNLAVLVISYLLAKCNYFDLFYSKSSLRFVLKKKQLHEIDRKIRQESPVKMLGVVHYLRHDLNVNEKKLGLQYRLLWNTTIKNFLEKKLFRLTHCITRKIKTSLFKIFLLRYLGYAFCRMVIGKN